MAARRELRILVLHNTDYAALGASAPNLAAVADVANASRGVAEALRRRRHRAELLGIDFPGLDAMLDSIASEPPDLVFNLCESLRGDARHEVVVPALLDLLGTPYTGSGPVALGNALRKDRAKLLLGAHGVPTPEAMVINSTTRLDDMALPFPIIVKPSREDASVGIQPSSVVGSRPALKRAVARVLDEHAQPALCERFVDGRELYVSLLGNGTPEVLPIHEIDFSTLPPRLPRIVSYSGKWDPSSPEYTGTQPTRSRLGAGARARVAGAAQAAFRALELADYARVDIRLAEDGTPYVIDVNPNCDLSEGAGYSRAASAAGLDYPSLCERIAEEALARSAAPSRRRPARGRSAADLIKYGRA